MSWISSLFGGGKKQQDDPLAGVRAQLQGLSSQIPGLVARQKEQIGKEFGAQREEGIKSIGEDVYANRGLGRTSIYDRLRTELVDKLARSQAQAELAADQWGMGEQSRILGQVGQFTPQAQPEEPSALQKILGAGAGLIGQSIGFGSNKAGGSEGSGSLFQSAADLIKGKAGASTMSAGGAGGGAYNADDFAKFGLSAASMIPGPQQPLVAGASMLSNLFGG